jgi:hypothetical protein
LRAIQRRAFRAVVRGEEALLDPLEQVWDQLDTQDEVVA